MWRYQSQPLLKWCRNPCAEHDAGKHSPDFLFLTGVWTSIERQGERGYFLLPSTRDLLHPCSADLKRKHTHINIDKKKHQIKLGVLRHSCQLGWSLPARVQQKHSAAGLRAEIHWKSFRAHGPVVRFGQMVQRLLLVSCCLLSSHLTERWKRLEK